MGVEYGTNPATPRVWVKKKGLLRSEQPFEFQLNLPQQRDELLRLVFLHRPVQLPFGVIFLNPFGLIRASHVNMVKGADIPMTRGLRKKFNVGGPLDIGRQSQVHFRAEIGAMPHSLGST